MNTILPDGSPSPGLILTFPPALIISDISNLL